MGNIIKINIENVNIRVLEKKDLKKGFLETLGNLNNQIPSIALGKEIFNYIKENDCYIIYVAEYSEKIVGTITLLIEQKFIHNGGKVCHLEDVCINKKYERNHIGTRLVEKAILEAKRKNCYKIILDCSLENCSFYKHFGFQKKEIQMRKNLNEEN